MNPILDQYQRICTDQHYRQALIENPRAVLSEEYGCTIPADINIEIVEEQPDTITLVIPLQPSDDDGETPVTGVVDLLFADGIGGFLIPNDSLKWALRDMRASWLAKMSADDTGTD